MECTQSIIVIFFSVQKVNRKLSHSRQSKMCIGREKFENTKRGYQKQYFEEGQSTEWPKEKWQQQKQTMIYKVIQNKIKIEQDFGFLH